MTINSPKLERYIAAYNAGASVRELAALVGVGDIKGASAQALVSNFNNALVRLGIVAKRKRPSPVILRGSEADEYRAWKASRASLPNAVAAE